MSDATKEKKTKNYDDEGHYWSKAERHQIANFGREIKDGGNIVQPERPLRFSNHYRFAKNEEEVTFIEQSDSFKSGDVIKVANAKEANILTAQQHTRKLNTMRQSTIEETDENPQIRTMG